MSLRFMSLQCQFNFKYRRFLDEVQHIQNQINKMLLNAGDLAVIGSRNAGDDDLSFTRQISAKAAMESIAI